MGRRERLNLAKSQLRANYSRLRIAFSEIPGLYKIYVAECVALETIMFNSFRLGVEAFPNTIQVFARFGERDPAWKPVNFVIFYGIHLACRGIH